MSKPDAAQQWQELKENYNQMSEDELCHVAEDAFDLVPIAREALQAVISERGLKIQLADAAVTEEPPEPDGVVETADEPYDKLVSVCRLRSPADAERAKAILDYNFIASCLGPDDIVDLADFKGSLDGGVDLKVFANDHRRASQALDQDAPDLADPELPEDEDEREYAVTCPKCQSEEVVFEGADPQPQNGDSGGKLNWTCAECSHQWKDDGIAHPVE